MRRFLLILLFLCTGLVIGVEAFPQYLEPVGLFFLAWFYILVLFAYVISSYTPRHLLRERLVPAVGTCIVFFSVLNTSWPMHLSFSFARPALEKIAKERWNKPDTRESVKQQCGPFLIRYVLRDRSQYPYFSNSSRNPGFIGLGWDRGYGFTGFVYSPIDQRPGNLNADIDLGDDWHFVVED
jgi:hypothetical protein